MRRIEAEQPRLDFLDREPRHRAGEARGEYSPFAAIGVLGVDDAIRQCERGFETIGKPRCDAVTHDDAVHHRLDLVLDLAVQRGNFANLVQLAVDLHAGEAAALQFGQFLAVFALAVAHDRREQQQARALRHRQHPVHHLRHGLRFDRQAGRWRIRHAGARP